MNKIKKICKAYIKVLKIIIASIVFGIVISIPVCGVCFLLWKIFRNAWIALLILAIFVISLMAITFYKIDD